MLNASTECLRHTQEKKKANGLRLGRHTEVLPQTVYRGIIHSRLPESDILFHIDSCLFFIGRANTKTLSYAVDNPRNPDLFYSDTTIPRRFSYPSLTAAGTEKRAVSRHSYVYEKGKRSV